MTILVTREKAVDRIARLFGLEAEQTIDMAWVAETEDLETVNEVYLKYLNEYIEMQFADED